MSRLIFKISYLFYLILSGMFLLSFIFFFISASLDYLELRDLKKAEDIKVSYQEVEELAKARTKNEKKEEFEDTEKNAKKSEIGASEEEKLIEQIRQLFLEKGYINFDKQAFKNLIHSKFPEERIRVSFLQGLKSVIELSSIDKLGTNIDIYMEEFEKKYTERKLTIETLEEEMKNNFIGAVTSFIIMVLIALSLAIFSIEKNVNQIVEALRNENPNSKG